MNKTKILSTNFPIVMVVLLLVPQLLNDTPLQTHDEKLFLNMHFLQVVRRINSIPTEL